MSATTLQGSLGALTLESLVRFLAENGLEGVLDLRNERGEYGALEIGQQTLRGAWWGQAAGEAALAAIVTASPQEFRFRAAATRPANLTGDVRVLFARARGAVATPSQASAVETTAAPAASDAGAPLPEGLTTVVRVGQADARPGAPIAPPAPKPLVPQRARTIGSVWKPGDLVALANGLIATYADGRYGGLIWERDLTLRIRRVDAQRALEPPLAIVAGSIDAVTLMRSGHPIDVIVPYLRAVVREVYREAERSCGRSSAERGYRGALQGLWGSGEELWAEALRMVETDVELRGRLTVTRGLPPRIIELVERDYSIGRATTSDVVLQHGTVSRRHATITPRQGRYVLRDLASTSGTLVNAKRITEPCELAHGDAIEFGQVAARFELVP